MQTDVACRDISSMIRVTFMNILVQRVVTRKSKDTACWIFPDNSPEIPWLIIVNYESDLKVS